MEKSIQKQIFSMKDSLSVQGICISIETIVRKGQEEDQITSIQITCSQR